MVKLNKHLILNSLWLQGYGGDYHHNIFRDIAITAQMSHLKNVLRLVGCSLELENPVMVYEYVEAISLYELIFIEGNHDQNGKSLSWGSRLQIANEVASVIVYLHTEFSTPIIYRNLSASNVIIDQNSGVAKIMDFSLSMSISLPQRELEVAGVVCGHSGYLYPEYMQSGIASQKPDVYSFGVVLFQLLTGKKLSILDGKMIDFIEFSHVETNIGEGSVMDIADPTILEEHGIEIRQLLEHYLHLVRKCTGYKGEEKPYMIHVAKELRQIEKCYCGLTLGQN
ncbi:wall-associated receptor kinase-like 22 [Nicotiana attenuata]|uniref:Wall-associated receptor kinase-like 22 n=2 Tax=Nicotiana attenuata TaxID=49451 RepID=A0A1J6IBS2_NICAT|nr:wall-associated receptor kinase-like 22 [Nicotiana attenuata]